MAVSAVDVRGPVESVVFPSAESNLLYVDDSVAVNGRDVADNSQSGLTDAVFFSYANLHQILSGARFNLVESPFPSPNLTLNSRIISASLGRAGRHVELTGGPVRVTLRHLVAENMTSPVCVFWDFEEHSWSDSGCRVAFTNGSITTCECDHLTNFALLMRPVEEGEVIVEEPVGQIFAGVFGRLDVFGSVVAAIVVFLVLIIALMVSAPAGLVRRSKHFLSSPRS